VTTEKEAGALVYLQEELTDARMRCDQLKRLVDKAVRLIAKSTHRDHFYEVAGDIIYGLPDTLFRLDKALDATALAASRLDYEELKQQLRPEKVEELELALKDVRIRHLDRRSPNLQPQPVAPQPIAPQNGKLAMLRLASTNFVSAALRGLADYIDDNPSPNRHVIIGGLHRVKMALSQTAQEAVEAMGPLQASSREDVMEGFKKANPSLSSEQLEEIADHWEANKDVVKDKQAHVSKLASYPKDWTMTRRMNQLYADFKGDVENALKDMEPQPGVARKVKLVWAPQSSGFSWLVVSMEDANGESKTFKLLPSEPNVVAGDILFKYGGY